MVLPNTNDCFVVIFKKCVLEMSIYFFTPLAFLEKFVYNEGRNNERRCF